MSDLSEGPSAAGGEPGQIGRNRSKNFKRRRRRGKNKAKQEQKFDADLTPVPSPKDVGGIDSATILHSGFENAGHVTEAPPAGRDGVARNKSHDPSQRRKEPVGSSDQSARQPSRKRSRGAYAALDLGTNNCRLLVAVPRYQGGFKVVDGFSRIVRLGEGLAQAGKLNEAAMDRAVEALKICAAKLKKRPIRKMRLIATEACRQAENGSAFLNRVEKETGLELEIVTREAEARLAARGCSSLLDRRSKAAVMFDIGGGSSELVLVNRHAKKGNSVSDKIVAWTSLPMGVVTLAEMFDGRDMTRDKFEQMTDFVSSKIEEFKERHALDSHFQSGSAHLLGTSGTVTTIAGIHLGLQKYDRKQVDGLWLTSNEIDTVIDRLLDMDFQARSENPCIGPDRADLVLAGCAILNAIRKVWVSDRLRVADRGLREGLLAEMMHDDTRRRPSGHNRRRNHNKSGRKPASKSENPTKSDGPQR